MDPELLTEKDKKIVYTEHYYPRKEQTVALFNSWYLGGMAHELGHGIGLPHDAGPPEKLRSAGYALMGSGNHHYREDRWGGKRASRLSIGSALRLISSPLVTNSNRARFESPRTQLSSLEFKKSGRAIRVAGSVDGSSPPYAVIAYLWRPRTWPGNPQRDHQSVSYPALVKDGKFDFEIDSYRRGDYRLRLAVLHCNGANQNFDYHLNVDATRTPDIESLNESFKLSQLEGAAAGKSDSKRQVSDDDIDAASTPELKTKLRVLQRVLKGPKPIDLTSTDQRSVSLSDAQWTSAKVGWGKVARNHYSAEKEARNSIYLELQSEVFERGLYAHSPSRFVYDLDGRWDNLDAIVGLRDGAHSQGSAIFTVVGDGEELFRSKTLRVGDREIVKVDLSGVRRLELIAEGAEGHNHNSWAIWAMPIVGR